MPGNVKLRILLADDHALVREGLKRLVNEQSDMEVVAEAGDGPEAVRAAEASAADVALVDVSMPVWDGVKTAQMLRAACAHMKIISVTRHDDQSFVRKMLEAGAAGYVLKQSPGTELIGAIRVVARGEQHVDPSVRWAPQPSTPSRALSAGYAESHHLLSHMEQEVLRLVALASSTRQIADHFSLDADAAAALKSDAMRKSGLSTRVEVIRYAVERGWITRG